MVLWLLRIFIGTLQSWCEERKKRDAWECRQKIFLLLSFFIVHYFFNFLHFSALPRTTRNELYWSFLKKDFFCWFVHNWTWRRGRGGWDGWQLQLKGWFELIQLDRIGSFIKVEKKFHVVCEGSDVKLSLVIILKKNELPAEIIHIFCVFFMIRFFFNLRSLHIVKISRSFLFCHSDFCVCFLIISPHRKKRRRENKNVRILHKNTHTLARSIAGF
jgi:hypothetical protein